MKKFYALSLLALMVIGGCLSNSTVDKIQHDNDLAAQACTQPWTGFLASLAPPPVDKWIEAIMGVWPSIEKSIVNPLWDLARTPTTRSSGV